MKNITRIVFVLLNIVMWTPSVSEAAVRPVDRSNLQAAINGNPGLAGLNPGNDAHVRAFKTAPSVQKFDPAYYRSLGFLPPLAPPPAAAAVVVPPPARRPAMVSTGSETNTPQRRDAFVQARPEAAEKGVGTERLRRRDVGTDALPRGSDSATQTDIPVQMTRGVRPVGPEFVNVQAGGRAVYREAEAYPMPVEIQDRQGRPVGRTEGIQPVMPEVIDAKARAQKNWKRIGGKVIDIIQPLIRRQREERKQLEKEKSKLFRMVVILERGKSKDAREIEELRRLTQSYVEVLNELKQGNETLSQQLRFAMERVQKLGQSGQLLNQHAARLQGELNEALERVDEQTALYEELANQNDKILEENDRMVTALRQSKSKTDLLKADKERTKNMIADIQTQMDRLIQGNAQLKQILADTEKDVDRLSRDKDLLQIDNRRLKDLNQQLNQNLGSLSGIIGKFQVGNVQKAREAEERANALQRQVVALMDELTRTKMDRDMAKATITQNNISIARLKREIESLRQKKGSNPALIQSLQNLVGKMEVSNSRLQEENNGLSGQNSVLKTILSKLERENKELANIVSRIETGSAGLISQVDRLSSIVTGLKEEIETAKDVRQEIMEKYSQENQDLKKEVIRLGSSLEHLKALLASSEEQEKLKDRRIGGLQRKVAELNQDVKELETLLDISDQDKSLLHEKLNQLTRDIEDLNTTNVQLQALVDLHQSIGEDYEKLQTLKNQAERQIKKLQKDIQNIERERNHWKNAHDSLVYQFQDQRKRLMALLHSMGTRIGDLTGEKESLLSQIDQLKQQLQNSTPEKEKGISRAKMSALAKRWQINAMKKTREDEKEKHERTVGRKEKEIEDLKKKMVSLQESERAAYEERDILVSERAQLDNQVRILKNRIEELETKLSDRSSPVDMYASGGGTVTLEADGVANNPSGPSPSSPRKEHENRRLRQELSEAQQKLAAAERKLVEATENLAIVHQEVEHLQKEKLKNLRELDEASLLAAQEINKKT